MNCAAETHGKLNMLTAAGSELEESRSETVDPEQKGGGGQSSIDTNLETHHLLQVLTLQAVLPYMMC